MSTHVPTRRSSPVAASVSLVDESRVAVAHEGSIALTPQGRASLDERLREIRDVHLRHLRPLLSLRERDERDVAEFERLSAEALSLEHVLGTSVTLAPTDCEQVELGSRVQILMPDGEHIWVRPVHPVEAFLDEERISVDSPVSQALLGTKVGDRVTVAGPKATWTCVVLDVRSVEEGLVDARP